MPGRSAKAAVAELLRMHAPDIFGIQEALPHQISELAAALPDYAWFGVGREADGGGEGVPVYYRKDRFTLLQSATFWLSEIPGSALARLGCRAESDLQLWPVRRENRASSRLWVDQLPF